MAGDYWPFQLGPMSNYYIHQYQWPWPSSTTWAAFPYATGQIIDLTIDGVTRKARVVLAGPTGTNIGTPVLTLEWLED